MKQNYSQNMILHAENVYKTFGTKGSIQQVLKGIDLRVLQGEFIGIMGPSGSRKNDAAQCAGYD